MSSEHLEKRFGIIAVEKGFVTPSQVLEAMEIQVKENMEKQIHRSLGEIMVEKGYLNPSQVNEILASLNLLL